MKYLFEKISSLLAFFLIVLVSLVSFGYAFDGGDGTMGDPYQVASCADLAEVNDHLDDYFLLTSDLDCSGSGNSIMIGDDGEGFRFGGEFDGGDHTITVAITPIGESYIGLFRRVNAATIKNLSIQGSIDAGTYSYAGGLAGYVEGASVIENISVDAILTGAYMVGGIAGYMYSSDAPSTINQVTFEGSLKGLYGYNAGIVGYFSNGDVSEAYVSGTIIVDQSIMSMAGGVFGYAYNGSIQQVGFNGVFSGHADYVGGIAGYIGSMSIADCYVNGSVRGRYSVGGLAGYLSDVSLSRCYVSADVSASYAESDYVGPILAYSSSLTHTGVFWNEELFIDEVESIGTALSTEQMQDIATYTSAEWDIAISSEDFLGNGNPYLARQVDEEDAVWYVPGLEVQTDLSVQIDDEGATGGNTYAHSYEIAYTNSGVDMENVTVYLSGSMSLSQVTLGAGTPSISASEDGSYIAWTGLSLLSGETKYLTFVITHATAGMYPYSVALDSTDTYTDVNTGNNQASITTTVAAPRSGQGSSVSMTTTTTSSPVNTDTNTDDETVTDEIESTESTPPASETESGNTSSGAEEGDDASDGTCAEVEYNEAYAFGFAHSLTTLPSCQEADMDGLLLRKHAAKIMSNYAVNVLGKSPDTNKVCDFDDMGDEDAEMNGYVRMACQLGIMGLQGDGITPLEAFNPNGLVDKAQFGTMLSRLLYGNTHDNNTACRYCDHIDALEEAGIVTVTTDVLDTLRRGYALLMLMRATDTNE